MNEEYKEIIEQRMLLLDMDIFTIERLLNEFVNYKVIKEYEGVEINHRDYFPALIESNNEIVFINMYDEKKFIIKFPEIAHAEYSTIEKIKKYQMNNTSLSKEEMHKKYLLFILCLVIPSLGLILNFTLKDKYSDYRLIAMSGFIANCIIIFSFILDFYNAINNI